MLRFIVDESTGTSVANCLRDADCDVVVVSESMPAADDVDILALAE